MSTIYDKLTAIANAIRGKTDETKLMSLDAMAESINSITDTNFTVVGGTTEPVNPSENMIWVNTDAEITGWKFSTIQPENASEGEVWICTGTSSTVEFNALKKNGITVYPLSAKQYVGGAWVDKTAQTYKSGTWSEWYTYLYKDGNEFESLTGGWSAFVGYSGAGYSLGKYTETDSGIVLQLNGSQTCVHAGSNNPIDLTNVSRLFLNITECTQKDVTFCVSTVRSKQTISNAVASMSCTDVGEYVLDVSHIQGEYYIAIGIIDYYSNTKYVKFDEVRMR